MKNFQDFLTAIMVSVIIGLAMSYVTILVPYVVDITFLEAVAIYHFWIHLANWMKSTSESEE